MSYKMPTAEIPSVIFVVFSSHPFVLFSVHFVLKPLVPNRISFLNVLWKYGMWSGWYLVERLKNEPVCC